MENKTIDELSDEAIRRYSVCLRAEKELADHFASDEFKGKLKKAELEWDEAHATWERGLKAYADQLSHK